MGKNFYAVRIGRVPGIYKTWEECQKQVNKFPKAMFKKFSDEKMAQAFIGSEDNTKAKKRKREKANELYTDGSIGSWGYVHVVDNEIVHEGFGEVVLNPKHEHYLGATKKTNNTGELTAIGEALRYYSTSGQSDKVTIRYDSMYAAKSVQGIFNGEKNKILIQNIRKLYEPIKEKVNFEHVKAHSGNKFNDRADKLASKKKKLK